MLPMCKPSRGGSERIPYGKPSTKHTQAKLIKNIGEFCVLKQRKEKEMEKKGILSIGLVLIVTFFIMLGTMSKAEQRRQTQEQFDREIRWEQTHQTVKPVVY